MVFSTAIFSSCEKTEVLQISELDWYYDESLDLYEADLDSVERFQQKVKDYATRYPETVSDPLYDKILVNIHTAYLRLNVEGDPTWRKVDIVFEFGEKDSENEE